ncbi:MAG: hydrogenase maturation nickel metallochaperone HypA [Pseudomonadota bacterium]
MGIAMQIVDIVRQAIPPQMKDVSVEAVNLKLGKLTAVVPESLRFCFTVVTKDTSLEGAKLHIEELPIVVQCRGCGFHSTIDTPEFKCAQCGGPDLDILSGRELTVSTIEMAEET